MPNIQSTSFNVLQGTDGKNIHQVIAELVDQLTLVSYTAKPEQKDPIDRLIDELATRSLELMEKELDLNTQNLERLETELSAATELAKDAVEDIDKAVDTIRKVARVVQLIDKIIAAGIKLLV